jgi:AraC family transcriptional regulator
MAPHADGQFRISVLLGGRLRESVGRFEEHAGPGSVAIKPAHVVHANRFGPSGAVIASIGIPLGLQAALPDDFAGRWRWVHGGPWGWRAVRLAFDLLEDPEGLRGVDRVTEWLAAVLETTGPVAGRTAPLPVQRVRRWLDDIAGAADVTLATLAAEVGFHPVYLARLFRRFNGCSISEYRQAARMAAAFEQIVGLGRPLSDAAAAAGFTDQAHMNRVFGRVLGRSPGGIRRRIATAARG